MIHWLRSRFVTGFFVLVPLVISIVALIWVFEFVDGFTAPLYERYFSTIGRQVPRGLGIVTTAAVVLLVGVVATNVWASACCSVQRVSAADTGISHGYALSSQLVLAFSPDNEYGFKRVVMIRTESRGYILGFLTKEFPSSRPAKPSRSLPSMCLPIISISVTWSSAGATTHSFQT